MKYASAVLDPETATFTKIPDPKKYQISIFLD